MRDELAEVMDDPDSVVIVEWADIVQDVLPIDHLTVKINASSENGREFIFTYTDKLNHLIPINT